MQVHNVRLYDMTNGEQITTLGSIQLSLSSENIGFYGGCGFSRTVAIPREGSIQFKDVRISLDALMFMFLFDAAPRANVDEFKRIGKIYTRTRNRRIRNKLYKRLCKITGWMV